MRINLRSFNILIVFLGSCLMINSAQADQILFDPITGFRTANYRSPILENPPGITAIDVQNLNASLRDDSVLIDVRPLKVFDIRDDGSWITPEPIQTIPGAIWLPGIGMGVMEAWAQDYLSVSLAEVARPDQTIIVFCRVDCWHSWNAVQRVAALGYSTLWFDGGVDAWQDAGNTLEPVNPWPVPELKNHRAN